MKKLTLKVFLLRALRVFVFVSVTSRMVVGVAKDLSENAVFCMSKR